jgi:hypothetical protein
MRVGWVELPMEAIEMARNSFFSSIGHMAVIATVAAVTLAAAAPAVAEIGSAGKGQSAASAIRGVSDFSARRRAHHGGAGAELVVVTPRYRRAYDSGYECSPVHCGPNYKREGAYSGYGAPIFTGW